MKRMLTTRLLAIVLCMVMLVTVTPLFSAAEIEISEITITYTDDTPTVGERAGDYMWFELPDGAPYTCNMHYWYDDTTGKMLADDDTFKEGDSYSLEWTIGVSEGYSFASNTHILLNDSEENLDKENTWILDDVVVFWTKRITPIVPPTTEIDEVAVTGANLAPVVGEKAGDFLSYELPDDAKYTCDNHYWYNASKDVVMKENDTFAAGDLYAMVWHLIPNEWCAFKEDLNVQVNDGFDLDSDNSFFGTTQCVIWTTSISPTMPTTVIDEVAVTGANLTPAARGKAGDFLSYELPDDAKYTCTSHYWYNISQSAALGENDTFAADDVYALVWVFTPNERCVFNEDLSVLVNGDDEIDWDNSSFGENQCTVWTTSVSPVISITEIDEVAVTGANLLPVIGKKAGDFLSYDLPGGAKYTCTSHYWYNISQSAALGENETFAADDVYALVWVFTPNEWCVFSKDLSILVNGDDEIDRHNSSFGENQCTVWTPSVSASVPTTPIDGVSIAGADLRPDAEYTVGGFLSYVLPDNAPYTCIDCYWYNRDHEERMEDGKDFIGGYEYSLVWKLVPKEGCFFTDGLDILLNEGDANADMSRTSVSANECIIWSEPVFVQRPLIRRINISGETTPRVGDHVGDYLSSKVSEYELFTCVKHYWYNRSEYCVMTDNDVFLEGGSYSAVWELVPKEGYAFSSNPGAYISGFGVDQAYSFFSSDRCVVWTSSIQPIPTIAEINLTDVDFLPIVGETVSDPLDYTIPENALYKKASANENFWIGDTNDNKFIAGVTYSRRITVTAAQGYVFGANTVVRVNGTLVSDDMGWNLVWTADGMFFRIRTPETKAVEPTPITEINLSGMDVAAIPGRTAGNLLHVTLPENSEYRVSKHCWVDRSNQTDMANQEAFVVGTPYAAHIELRATPGYVFAETVSVTINGSTDAVDFSVSRRSGNQKFDIWTKMSQVIPESTFDSGIHLMVGQTWVNTTNAADVLGDGRVRYDDETKTLSLSNTTLLSCMYVIDAQANCSVYADQFITIHLTGFNMLYQSIATMIDSCCAIFVRGSGNECPPILTGDGSLTIYSGDSETGDSIAIFESSSTVEIAFTGRLYLQTGICGETGISNPISCSGSVLFSGFNDEQEIQLLSGTELSLQCKFPVKVTAMVYSSFDEEGNVASSEYFDTDGDLVCFRSGEGLAAVEFSAYKEIIDTIEIDGFCYPITNGRVGEYLHLVLPENAPYHFDESGYYWMNDTDSTRMDNDGIFEAGKPYTLGGTLVADEGYIFDKNLTILLNDGKFGVFEGRSKRDDFDTRVFHIWGELQNAVSGYIDTIEIDGFCVPVYGGKAGDYLNLTIPEDAPYHFAEGDTYWCNYADMVRIRDSSKFEPDIFYSIVSVLVANEGYIFTNRPTILLNGGEFEVDTEHTYRKGSDAGSFLVSGESKAISDIVIDTIEINGICNPVVGDKAGDYLNLTIAEGLPYHFAEDGLCWYDYSSMFNLEDDDTFKENTLYALGGTLIADEGYVFAKEPTVLLNDGAFAVDKEYTYRNGLNARSFDIFTEPQNATAQEDPVDPDDPVNPDTALGDANEDEAVDMKDVLTMRKYLAGMNAKCNIQNADVNEDGAVDMKDVLMLRKFLAGLIDKLGA